MTSFYTGGITEYEHIRNPVNDFIDTFLLRFISRLMFAYV